MVIFNTKNTIHFRKFYSHWLLVLVMSISFQVSSSEINAEQVSAKNTSELNVGSSLIQHNKLNINQASFEQLIAIKGLGKIKAQAILDHIKQYGKFVSIDELIEVKGVGEKMVEKIKPHITI